MIQIFRTFSSILLRSREFPDGTHRGRRRQELDRTDLARRRGRLTGQVAVEPLEARVGDVEITDAVEGVPLDGVGDMGGLAPLQQDRDETGTTRLIVVNAVVDQIPLPPYAVGGFRVDLDMAFVVWAKCGFCFVRMGSRRQGARAWKPMQLDRSVS